MNNLKKGLLILVASVVVFVSIENISAKAATSFSIEEAITESDIDKIKSNTHMPGQQELEDYVTSAITAPNGEVVWLFFDPMDIDGKFYNYMEWTGARWDFGSCDYIQMQQLFRITINNYILIVSSVNISTAPSATATSEHTHSYEWVTTQEVTADQDGMEEYRCSCGDVQERGVIPCAAYVIRGFTDAVNDAAVNGTATYDSGNLYCMTDRMIETLAKRSDVTTVVTFQYEKVEYQMRVPAGTDFTSVLTDEEYFYGYFGFAAKVGATITAL